MSEWSSEETQQALADLADPDLYAAQESLPDAMRERRDGPEVPEQAPEDPPLLAANLGLASTRELIEELEARGILLGGHDGRQMATTASVWLRSVSGSLASYVLEYRTVDLNAPPSVSGDRPQQALACRADPMPTSSEEER